MSKISCSLRLGEVPLHLYHITAGYLMLQRHGIIDLEVERLPAGDKRVMPYNMMEVLINNEVRVLYDVNDGYDNLLKNDEDYTVFMDSLLKDIDICFKRSCHAKYNANLNMGYKIVPLGLNYMVTIPGNISHRPTMNDPKKERIKKWIRRMPFSQYNNRLYDVNSFEASPRFRETPRILFMARLWDVQGEYPGQISNHKMEERTRINETRVACIRKCREEFGSSFLGGITPSAYGNKHYPDLVIHDKKSVSRNHYLATMKDSDICIATMGLHESIGWKFAEYIAASKAVVTEPLFYEVPGGLTEENNYLMFRNPDECVEQIDRLIQQDELRYAMMVNNYKYYHNYVRPDRLVLNSIQRILEGAPLPEIRSGVG